MKCTVVAAVVLGCAFSVGAAEFLGIDLCQDQVATGVTLPDGSPLRIVSVEVGKYGALVILLEGDGNETLGQVDDLMLAVTGARGVGDSDTLQWSGRLVTAFAEVVKKGFVALAVSSSDSCREVLVVEQEAGAVEIAGRADNPGPETVAVDEAGAETGAKTAEDVVAVAVVEDVEAEPVTDVEDFVVRGDIVHTKAADAWVDVMGVVANNSGRSYRLASFDLSFYDASGALTCIDTISVSVLKDGQERAFRDSINCPNYVAAQVVRTELQFAGGY